MFRFKARIARNSWLLRRFATQKLDILDARYEFMNRPEVPYSFAPAITAHIMDEQSVIVD
jgi:hypothetical protein